jgi:hypothetical protein
MHSLIAPQAPSGYNRIAGFQASNQKHAAVFLFIPPFSGCRRMNQP